MWLPLEYVMTSLRFAVCLVVLAAPHLRAQARAPRIFVSGFVAHDSTSLDAAAQLRVQLAGTLRPEQVEILSAKFIRDMMDSGTPDDFGGTWGIIGVREALRAYRAAMAVELKVTRTDSGFELHTTLISYNPADSLRELPMIPARTVHDGVRLLAQRFAKGTAPYKLPSKSAPHNEEL